MPFKVAVWNCYAGGKDPTDDLRLLAEPLKSVDIALLQELERFTNAARKLDQPAVIAKTAGFSYVHSAKRFNWDGGERVDAILSRFPLYNKTYEKLPQRPFWSRGFGGPGPRVIALARADVGGSLGRVQLGSTRWTNNTTDPPFEGEDDRILQSTRCRDLLRGYPGPVIWGGDLNAKASAWSVINVLDEYKSAMDLLPSGRPDEIDFLLYKGRLQVSQPQLFRGGDDWPDFPSDHPLLIASFDAAPSPAHTTVTTPTAATTAQDAMPASISGSGDYITVRIENAGLGTNAEVVLEAAPNISWYKEVKLGDRKAWTKNDRRRDSFTLSARELAAQELVFYKAKFLGISFEVHRLWLKDELYGKRVTFRWLKDS